jgi:hypothetical protein
VIQPALVEDGSTFVQEKNISFPPETEDQNKQPSADALLENQGSGYCEPPPYRYV